MAIERDHYAILGVRPGAAHEEIQRGFRQKILAAHPDRGGSARQMLIIKEAWETLRDPGRRAAYDVQHGFRASAPGSGTARGGAQADGGRTGGAARRTGKRGAGGKRGPRAPSLAQIAGTMFGKAFRALTGWGAPKPKVKRRAARPAAPIVRCVNCSQRMRVRKTVPGARIVCPRCKHVQPGR